MSDDRDLELDALEREFKQMGQTPHIHQPDEKNVEHNGMCWINVERLCGPDCVAFGDPAEPDPGRRCRILNVGETFLERLFQIRTPGGPSPIYPVPNPMGSKP